MCHEWKPETDFAFRSIKTGKRQSHCRKCHAAYRREHYVRTKATYIENERLRMRDRRRQNRALLLDYLLAHPCVDCGETDAVVLDFDHRDPTLKRTEVAKLASRQTWATVLAEIANCDVRCASCHRRRTADQFNWRRVTLSLERRDVVTTGWSEPTRLRSAIAPALPGTKVCRVCGQELPLSEFAVKNRDRGIYQSKCRACQRAYAREHYQKNKKKYLDKASDRNVLMRDRFAAFLLAYFEAHGCVDCGTRDPAVLEFDHKERPTKVAAVSTLVRTQSWSALFAEIDKCEVRCANCHRRRTAKQFGYFRQAARLAEAS
jgi:hypothetical protein